jgi:cell division protein FtsZ
MQTSFPQVSSPAGVTTTGNGLLFVGVGKAGTKLVQALAAADLAGTRCVCVNTRQGLSAAGADEVIFGDRITRGFGCGGDVSHGRQAAEQDAPALRELFTGARIVVLVAGLGGGTGGGATPVIAKLARDCGALVIGLATLPFRFESPLRHATAKAALQPLRSAADVVLCLSNTTAAEMLDEKTALPDVMAHSNTVIAETVKGFWRLVARPGLIPVGVGDLERLFRDMHGESAFATVEGHGEHRAREAFERLVAHPFLKSGCPLTEAEAVVINLAAAGDLRLDELEWLQRQFQNHCERARLVLGASDDPALRGRLAITVIAARAGVAPVSQPVVSGGGEPVAGVSRLPSSKPEAPLAFTDLDMEPDMPRRGAPKAGSPSPEPSGSSRRPSAKTIFGKRKTEQQTFNFETISKGRFEHAESTMYQGQNLDEPTFVRRGVTLN